MRRTHPRETQAMRRIPTLLLLAAAFAACGPCLAQQARPRNSAGDVGAMDAGAGARSVEAPAQRSAFGRVMAVMISSLQHQAREREHPVASVRTSAAGTPLGIEVGGAFRTDAPQGTGTG